MTGLLRHLIVPLAALGLLVAVVGGVFAQEPAPTALLTAANERYERGEYAEAAQQYEALIYRGYEDVAIYYNLGNTYSRRGDLGRAILSYLRAEALSPRDLDIRANLDLARSRTIDRIEAERDSLIESVAYLGHRWLTPGELGAVALLLWAISGLAIGTLLVGRTIPLRAVLRTGALVASAATLVSFLLLLSMVYANPYGNTGVVTRETVEVVSGPGPQYPKAFTLHSGAQVRLTDSRHGWLRVALPGGELQGWAPAHAIEAVGDQISQVHIGAHGQGFATR